MVLRYTIHATAAASGSANEAARTALAHPAVARGRCYGRAGDGAAVTDNISIEKFIAITELVAQLTELRVKYCNHLCIENYAPELFEKLLRAAKKGEWT